MKKLILTVAISAIMTTVAFADKIVAPETAVHRYRDMLKSTLNQL